MSHESYLAVVTSRGIRATQRE